MQKQRLRSLRKNKRGDLTDIILYVVVGVFLAIALTVTIFVNNIIKEDVIEGTALGNTSASAAILDSFDTINNYTTQRAYAMFMGLLMISVVASAFLVRLHPAFIFLYIIMLAFTLFVSVYLGNMYEEFISNPVIWEIAQNQTMINFFMLNIVKITLATGALSMIVAFSKIFSGFDGGGDI